MTATSALIWRRDSPDVSSRLVNRPTPEYYALQHKGRNAFAQLVGDAPGFDIMDLMKRHEGPQTPYEVYCYDCRVTFAAGTSRCVHCGGRLGGLAMPTLGRRDVPFARPRPGSWYVKAVKGEAAKRAA